MISCIAVFGVMTFTAANAQLVNIDVGGGDVPVYSSLGVLSNSAADTVWNQIGTTGSNFVAADGSSLVGTSLENLALTLNIGFTQGGAGNTDQTNLLLKDYVFVSGYDFFPVQTGGEISITGLQADTDYEIVVYATGDGPGQGSVVILNGEIPVGASGLFDYQLGNGEYGLTNGAAPTENNFIENENYMALEVKSDNTGAITGKWFPLRTTDGPAGTGAINGFQIRESTLPTRVLAAQGAESPTINLAGADIEVTLEFSEPVGLSQTGGATITLDFAGAQVTATHTGPIQGKKLSFTATAPAGVTASGGSVIQDSLTLTAGTLLDESGIDVPLTHPAFPLPNDQLSQEKLSVYSTNIPDPASGPEAKLDQSQYYRFRVRDMSLASENWLPVFAWVTQSAQDGTNTGNSGSYEDFVGGWSHTYGNFEMAQGAEVEIEITRLGLDGITPVDIQSAVPQPRRKVKSWRVENGKAYVVIDKPVLLAIDIDGQFDQPSQIGQVNENALHAVSIFANPFILDKPPLEGEPGSENVLYIEPGDPIPSDNEPESIYFFKKGVHQLFTAPWGTAGGGQFPGGAENGSDDDYRVRSGKTYYIPGDAIVHAAFNNEDDQNDGVDVRFYGHGTISGERIPHHSLLAIDNEGDTYHRNKPLRINGAIAGRVEGITIADSANHSLAVKSKFEAKPEDNSFIRWTKVVTWRANGDGISANGSAYLEDSFLRTQDDGTYVLGLGVRRNTYWSDVNGMPLRLSNILTDQTAIYRALGKLVVEEIDILYSRGVFNTNENGHAVIGYPSPPNSYQGNDGSHILFKNIYAHDRFPTRRLFGMDTYSEEYSFDNSMPPMAIQINGTAREDRIPIASIRFENVRSLARPALPAPSGNKEYDFSAWTDSPISGLVFDNVSRAGEPVATFADFSNNNNFAPGPADPPPTALDFLPPVGVVVSGFSFPNSGIDTLTFSAQPMTYNKWSASENWSTGVQPANNDIVNHGAGQPLVVDDYAYAGEINIDNAATTLVVRRSGELTINNQINIGDAGQGGQLRIEDGTLILASNLSSALNIADGGKLVIEQGTLVWTGLNHSADIQSLFDEDKIELSNGQQTDAPTNGTLVGSSNGNELYIVEENGNTTLLAIAVTSQVEVAIPWLAIVLLSGVLALIANMKVRRSSHQGQAKTCSA